MSKFFTTFSSVIEKKCRKILQLEEDDLSHVKATT